MAGLARGFGEDAAMRVEPPSGAEPLVARALAGEAGAFETLYRRHVGRVYALCRRLSGDAEAAAELTQDVFVRAFERLGQFRGESAFGSWLHRLAVNVVLTDRRARRRREARVMPSGDLAMLDSGGGSTPPTAGDVDLERGIAALPPQARLVFVLHDVEGYEHREIAAVTGLAEGTSKAHLHRARRLLRESLQS